MLAPEAVAHPEDFDDYGPARFVAVGGEPSICELYVEVVQDREIEDVLVEVGENVIR